ncbi:hypothetical protein [Mesorhizobium sp.]|uniref:hypothetical protein n=1 Tax=Mesorhizobium sp. TaxID=1871066 RepID=UPI00257C73A4|nr:hypothetical protein [Mesorhizobium sp.]
MALLNRWRVLPPATSDSRPPQPLATPCPHGHLDIADLTNFPTGRAFWHVFDTAYALDDRTQNRTSTAHQLQPLQQPEGLPQQREIPRQRQR